MSCKMVYVIQDEEGGYPTNCAFTKTDQGWVYSYLTGDCDGFVYYLLLKTAEEDLAFMQQLIDKYGFKKEFHIEYIDLNTIEKGVNLCKLLHSLK